jgi:hypothetical protein
MELAVRTFANGVQLKLIDDVRPHLTFHARQGTGFCTDSMRCKCDDPFRIGTPLACNRWAGVLQQEVDFTQPVCVTLYDHAIPSKYYSAAAAVDTEIVMPMRYGIYDDRSLY